MIDSLKLATRLMAVGCLASFLAIGGIAIGQDPKDENPGIQYLDEATDLRLKRSDSVEDLAKLIAAAEKAIEVGLDESNRMLAKEMIASASFQRAQATYATIVQSRNPGSLARLRASMVSDLKKAIANNPNLPDPYLLMAIVEDGAKAGESLSKAIELLKDEPEKLARAYLMRGSKVGSPEERLADFKKVVEINPKSDEGWQVLIAMQLQMGKLEDALNDAKKLLESEPENLFAIKATLETLLALDRKQEALALLDQKLDRLPDSAELRVQRADMLMNADRNEEALVDLNKALEMDARNGEALLKRCQIRLGAGEYDKAEQDVEDLLILVPNQPLALYYRSLIAANQKRMPDAIADLQQVIQMVPDSAEFRWQLGTFYQLDDRPRKSIQVADEILKNKKETWQKFHIRALRMRGDARLSLGEHKEAIADFEQALKLLGDKKSEDENVGEEKSGLLNNLAWVLATSPIDAVRDGERSIKLSLEACELTEYKETHILSTLASGYAEVGKFEEAEEWAKKAVSAGERDNYSQLDQLKKELESYRQKKPWREKQETKDKKAPIVPSSGGVDT